MLCIRDNYNYMTLQNVTSGYDTALCCFSDPGLSPGLDMIYSSNLLHNANIGIAVCECSIISLAIHYVCTILCIRKFYMSRSSSG